MVNPTKRGNWAWLAGGVVLPCLFGGAALATAPRPNIVVIVADDMGFSDIGSYGGEIATPNLDSLAENGLRYTRFYNTSRCCPTRAALLTGLYPHQAGVGQMVDAYAAAIRAELKSPAYTDRLSPDTPTIAEVLKSAGYRTYMAGKWHLGYRPEEWPVARGFDRSFVMVEGAMNYYGYGPQHSLPAGEQGHGPMALDDAEYVPPREGFFTTEAFTDYAIECIREERGQESPFFLYLAHNAPHWPLHARPETIAKYRGKYAMGWDKLREERHERLVAAGIIDAEWPLAERPENLPAWEAVTEQRKDTWDEWMAVYAAQVEEMDSAIGRVLAVLRETNEEENTLVLFFSDNGGAAERPVKTISNAALGSRESYEGYALGGAHVSSAPFRKTKKYTHEGGIASPLIAYWPRGIDRSRRGTLNTETGHVIDIMATSLDLAGTTMPRQWNGKKTAPIEGVSLAPTFSGRKIKRAQPLFWEHEGHRAVRHGRWKIVSSFGERWELYDLEADGTESNDLALTRPATLKRLAGNYDEWADRAGVLPWVVPPRPASNSNE